MNIDNESIDLLNLVLQDSPKDRQLILCVLARSNTAPKRITLSPNTEYPTFYGYSNSRIPIYLMGKGVLSNVPREVRAKKLISSHYLSYAETVINRAKNWDMHDKLMSVSKFITLDNKTAYKDAEVFLVFRDKALDYIKGSRISETSTQESLESVVVGNANKVHVKGYIPARKEAQNVQFQPIYRDWQDRNLQFVPFSFKLRLPPLRKARIILERNNLGQLLKTRSPYVKTHQNLRA